MIKVISIIVVLLIVNANGIFRTSNPLNSKTASTPSDNALSNNRPGHQGGSSSSSSSTNPHHPTNHPSHRGLSSKRGSWVAEVTAGRNMLAKATASANKFSNTNNNNNSNNNGNSQSNSPTGNAKNQQNAQLPPTSPDQRSQVVQHHQHNHQQSIPVVQGQVPQPPQPPSQIQQQAPLPQPPQQATTASIIPVHNNNNINNQVSIDPNQLQQNAMYIQSSFGNPGISMNNNHNQMNTPLPQPPQQIQLTMANANTNNNNGQQYNIGQLPQQMMNGQMPPQQHQVMSNEISMSIGQTPMGMPTQNQHHTFITPHQAYTPMQGQPQFQQQSQQQQFYTPMQAYPPGGGGPGQMNQMLISTPSTNTNNNGQMMQQMQPPQLQSIPQTPMQMPNVVSSQATANFSPISDPSMSQTTATSVTTTATTQAGHQQPNSDNNNTSGNGNQQQTMAYQQNGEKWPQAICAHGPMQTCSNCGYANFTLNQQGQQQGNRNVNAGGMMTMPTSPTTDPGYGQPQQQQAQQTAQMYQQQQQQPILHQMYISPQQQAPQQQSIGGHGNNQMMMGQHMMHGPHMGQYSNSRSINGNGAPQEKVPGEALRLLQGAVSFSFAKRQAMDYGFLPGEPLWSRVEGTSDLLPTSSGPPAPPPSNSNSNSGPSNNQPSNQGQGPRNFNNYNCIRFEFRYSEFLKRILTQGPLTGSLFHGNYNENKKWLYHLPTKLIKWTVLLDRIMERLQEVSENITSLNWLPWWYKQNYHNDDD